MLSPFSLDRQSHRYSIFTSSAEQQEGAFKPATQKRRSVFRSPGTASSPDLATLVKRAKEAKYQPEPSQEPIPQATQPNGAPKILSKAGPSRPPPISVQSSQSYASSSTARTARDRSTSYTSAPGESEDGWDKFSNGDLKSLPSGERMATISEGRGRQSSGEDGFKVCKRIPGNPCRLLIFCRAYETRQRVFWEGCSVLRHIKNRL